MTKADSGLIKLKVSTPRTDSSTYVLKYGFQKETSERISDLIYCFNFLIDMGVVFPLNSQQQCMDVVGVAVQLLSCSWWSLVS